ncbi:MAG: YggS family pyridoxal phosphate-dependent enzyme [Rhodospirillales bacterium]|nr:MAG: YggS family pyridoxal phosphate-dependent enzyme [Rhodospirillales bacterium]
MVHAEATTGADIGANLAAVKAEIAKAAAAVGRDPVSITLVAIAKTHGPDALRAAIAAGQRVFGENRVQEAEAKWPPLKAEVPDLRLHLVGPLQRNKVKRALDLFDVIESLDRPALARALAEAMERSDRRPDLLIQVNTGEEPQKNGILPQQADAFIRGCLDDLGLPIRGLMCVPPVDEEPALHFGFLKSIAERNGLAELSMGMTADFPVAVRFGATMIRVGTAIFGSRPSLAP